MGDILLDSVLWNSTTQIEEVAKRTSQGPSYILDPLTEMGKKFYANLPSTKFSNHIEQLFRNAFKY